MYTYDVRRQILYSFYSLCSFSPAKLYDRMAHLCASQSHICCQALLPTILSRSYIFLLLLFFSQKIFILYSLCLFNSFFFDAFFSFEYFEFFRSFFFVPHFVEIFYYLLIRMFIVQINYSSVKKTDEECGMEEIDGENIAKCE